MAQTHPRADPERSSREAAWRLDQPRLAWCDAYQLEADCVLCGGRELGRLVLRSGDPILPARELSAFDSKLEARFARAFAKLAPEWDVIREPRAMVAGASLVFPDFELRHRGTGERWLLEVMGYWTPDYVRKKLAQLAEAKIQRLIVCVDEARCCEAELAELGARVVTFRRKLDPRAVLAIVDPSALQRAGADRASAMRGSAAGRAASKANP